MSEKREPIIIPELGLIYGRDAIFIDDLKFTNGLSCVQFKGEINGLLCDNVNDAVYVSYDIVFPEILDFRLIELDFYRHKQSVSSFEKVINSKKLSEFRNSYEADQKMNNRHEHFIFHTYDQVFEIVSTKYKLEIGKVRHREDEKQ